LETELKTLRWILKAVLITLSLIVPAHGQYVTVQGTLQSSNGLPAKNYVISFTPSQWFYVAGTGVAVNTTAYCATTTDGIVVGLANPLQSTVVTPGFTGTLPAANYYVVFTFYDAAGNETLPSPESTANLSSTGNLTIPPPVSGIPAAAVGMKVYIGTSSGGETLQGSTVGTATFNQSTPLATGANPPGANSTICKQIANDAGWPTGTGYTVSVTTPAGNTLPGYPMLWALLGPNTTINISNGLPYYHGVVTFPVPILASPLNHAAQSISGPLSLTGYNLVNVGEIGVGTGLPAWGVDVEGSGLAGVVNAKNGYLVNGTGGTLGYCLSIGASGRYDTPFNCAGSGGTSYQTFELNGAPATQRPALNFIINGAVLSVTDSVSPARTNVTFNTTGNGANFTTSTTPGASGRCAQWDAAGNVGAASAGCATATNPIATSTSGTLVGGGGSCDHTAFPASGYYFQVGSIYFQSVTGKQQSDCSDVPNNPQELIVLPHACSNAILSTSVTNLAPTLGSDDTHQASQSLVSVNLTTVKTQRYRSADHGGDPSAPVIAVTCY
jgi:hypothetical protein